PMFQRLLSAKQGGPQGLWSSQDMTLNLFAWLLPRRTPLIGKRSLWSDRVHPWSLSECEGRFDDGGNSEKAFGRSSPVDQFDKGMVAHILAQYILPQSKQRRRSVGAKLDKHEWAVAPDATVILILVTLLGALPVYAQVAGRSYAGQGSIAMLE